MKFDTIIIGGGAAGLMCAIEAGKRGRKTLLIEKADQLGKKILISGGGRCNFTNIYCTPENYISENPHFCKSALSRYSPYDFIELVEKYNIAYHEKTLGQQFCDGSSRQIVGLLKNECDKNNVQIILNSAVTSIKKEDRFFVETEDETYSCESLVIASGGLSIPKMGATDFGHQIAKQFNHTLVTCRPGLVPLTFNNIDLEVYSPLSGISASTVVECKERSFKESFLFTHKGISGPAILQISSYWKPGDLISMNLSPNTNLQEDFKNRKFSAERSELKTVFSNFFPKKLAEVLAHELLEDKPQSIPFNQYSDKEIEKFSEKLHNWKFKPNGTEGYPKAEVTIGGVNTDELSSKTMESKKVSGLFFIGEVVDVTGHLGGFNFQWAWASGHAAGQYC